MTRDKDLSRQGDELFDGKRNGQSEKQSQRSQGCYQSRARCIRVRESVLDPRNAGGGLKVQQKRGEAWEKRGPLRHSGGNGRWKRKESCI